MKIAIYLRVSTQDQTVENQRQPLIQYCERMGWEFEVFEEKESTRKTRPIQWNLYNSLLRREYDGLVIYKFDRWARSTKELIEHMERLIEKGIKIYSYSENLDLDTSMGKAMLTIISAFAQLERDLIRERTLAGLARAKAQGKKLGRKSKLSINEIIKLRKDGLSYEQIGKKFGVSKQAIYKRIKCQPNTPNKT